MNLKRNINSLALIGILFVYVGCSKDNVTPQGAFKNGTTQVVASSSATTVTGAEITEFRINIENIRFRTIVNDPLLPDNTIQIAPLVGPFDLLLIGTGTGSTIPESPLPNATYDRVDFDLVRGKSAPMTDITVWITGTIGTIPFEMWHDTEPGFRSNFNDLVINSNALNFSIDFVLDGLDLSGAKDGDGDGTIQINPNDNDGNNNLADDIVVYIENNFNVTY